MNITFVVPDYNYIKLYLPDYRGSFHHGIAYILSFLKSKGHNVSLLHLLKPPADQEFLGRVKSFSPGLIAFTSFTHQFREVKRLVSCLKNNLKVPIMCGGVHCTIDPKRALLESDLDMVCIGEGEEAMLELADAIQNGRDYSNIRNIWLKHNGRITENPIRPLLEDLDSLPFPDWDIFHYESLTETNTFKWASVLATRGCPRNCSFCCNHALRSVYPNKNKYVRIRSAIKVIEEIEAMLEKYHQLKAIHLLDDTVGLYADWLEEFSYLYNSRISLPMHCNSRVEIVNNDKKLESFKRMGVETIRLGVESGDEAISKVLNRQLSNEEIIRAIKRCRESGIRVLSYNMVGLPFEDMGKILKTIRLNVKAHTDVIHVSIFQPYPNTDLYKLCVKEDFIKEGELSEGYFDRPILKQRRLSKNSVIFSHRFFYIYFVLFTLADKLPGFTKKITERFLSFTFKNRLWQSVLLLLYYPLITRAISNKYIKKIFKALVQNEKRL